jgi:hypothetical protein
MHLETGKPYICLDNCFLQQTCVDRRARDVDFSLVLFLELSQCLNFCQSFDSDIRICEEMIGYKSALAYED